MRTVLRSVVVKTTALALAVLALLGAYLLLATFVLHGPVNERSLLRSVSGVADSVGEPVEPCVPDERPTTVWSCTVGDREGSGTAQYRVTVSRGSSCWETQLVLDHSEGGMPRMLSGCVRKLEWSLL